MAGICSAHQGYNPKCRLCNAPNDILSDQDIDTIVTDRIITVLNRAIKEDRGAIESLCVHRVDCNENLADDPTIQVGAKDNNFRVGLIGILSGIAGQWPDGFSRIWVVYDEVCADCGKSVDQASGEKCPYCGGEIVMGNLIEFQKTVYPPKDGKR
jgi:DNA-directed RNA polymerase subunit RPC12/RpoP